MSPSTFSSSSSSTADEHLSSPAASYLSAASTNLGSATARLGTSASTVYGAPSTAFIERGQSLTVAAKQ